jgi:hypothetical protein
VTSQQLRGLVGRKPFHPFKIHLADGDVIVVKSPEFVWLHPAGRVIYVATGTDEQAEDRVVDLLLVTQLSTGNGLDRPDHPSPPPQSQPQPG